MAAVVGRLELSLKDIEPVKDLIQEADMAVQILAGEKGAVVEAVKEGLETALDNLRNPSE